jgi:hypothetical protein
VALNDADLEDATKQLTRHKTQLKKQTDKHATADAQFAEKKKQAWCCGIVVMTRV